ncbi:MAG TPA: nucleoside 2-deoxyribosyltransferase [Rhodopila sp.]|jgi:nucleoside 2-deoxyribosyltransferase
MISRDRRGTRVYLAGPMVFYPDPDTTFQQMKAICRRHGLTGVSPLDNQLGLEGLAPDRALLEKIVKADIELMDRLDGGLFCLDGFRRSSEMDAGTAFEVGYMRALKKPMAGWSRDPRHYPAKVKDHFETTYSLTLISAKPGVTGGTSGTMRDPDGILVHSEACLQNAMIDFGITTTGGQVFAQSDWEIAFDQAAACLADLLLRGR